MMYVNRKETMAYSQKSKQLMKIKLFLF